MEFVLTPDQMMAADRATIAAGTPLEMLMDRAGWALARAARDVMGGTYGRRAVVVCGKGNNGRDGLVAAQVLEHWGCRSAVFGLEDGFDGDGFSRSLRRADVALDCMFGTGQRGGLHDDAAIAAESLNGAGVPIVACDIPSGVDGLTGAVETVAVRAAVTVCFEAAKSGVVFEPGASHAGAVVVAPIGVSLDHVPGSPGLVLGAADVRLLVPRRDVDTHKWAAGGVMVVAGKAGMLGAANLVGRAALRSGAGIVVLGLPGADLAARAAGGEVVTHALAETPEGLLDEPAAKEVLDGLERFGALVVGPGLGTDDRTRAAVLRLVAEAEVPTVVDADGLNAVAGDASVLASRSNETVLTPHAGEYARLAGHPLGDDRSAAALELAEATGAVVVLKGTTTVVADPQGRLVLNRTGGPWLATAGTGDVLAGVIGALLARRLPAFDAAAVGAWLHGAAADGIDKSGLVAGDLAEALPSTLTRLGVGV